MSQKVKWLTVTLTVVAVAVTVVVARHKDNALAVGYGPLSDGGM